MISKLLLFRVEQGTKSEMEVFSDFGAVEVIMKSAYAVRTTEENERVLKGFCGVKVKGTLRVKLDSEWVRVFESEEKG